MMGIAMMWVVSAAFCSFGERKSLTNHIWVVAVFLEKLASFQHVFPISLALLGKLSLDRFAIVIGGRMVTIAPCTFSLNRIARALAGEMFACAESTCGVTLTP